MNQPHTSTDLFLQLPKSHQHFICVHTYYIDFFLKSIAHAKRMHMYNNKSMRAFILVVVAFRRHEVFFLDDESKSGIVKGKE